MGSFYLTIIHLPRPGNLWVILGRMTPHMCATALIDSGFSDVADPRRRVSFHSQFFSRQLGPPLCALIDSFSLPPPCFRFVLVATKGPSNKGAPAHCADLSATADSREDASSNGQRQARSLSSYPQILPRTHN